MSFTMKVEVHCPFCKKENMFDYQDISHSWGDIECYSCGHVFNIKIDETDNKVIVKKPEDFDD